MGKKTVNTSVKLSMSKRPKKMVGTPKNTQPMRLRTKTSGLDRAAGIPTNSVSVPRV